jgi:glycosyltransferase involved in cell wall biosynthesis
MRIGMITACYHPVINGVTQMVSLYRRHLTALGHEVTIFTLGEPDPCDDELKIIRSPGLPVKDGYHLGWRYSRKAQARLRQMQVIHCHHLGMGMEFAYRYSNGPIMFTNHTRYDLHAGVHLPLPQRLVTALMRQIWPKLAGLADVVVTPSASMRTILREFGVQGRIEVIANGIDLESFRQPNRPLTKDDLGLDDSTILCLYVGRLSLEKRVDVLLAQFALAQKRIPKAHLMLIGSGTQQNPLKRQAERLGIAPFIHFAGAVAPQAIPDYLAAADIFVTTSPAESHPLAVMEAMAAGLPVAAPVAPGLVDLIASGLTGLLVRDPQPGLASALVTLGTDEAERHRLGRAAQIASERFDIRKTIEQTLAIYERLCQTRPDLHKQRANSRGSYYH